MGLAPRRGAGLHGLRPRRAHRRRDPATAIADDGVLFAPAQRVRRCLQFSIGAVNTGLLVHMAQRRQQRTARDHQFLHPSEPPHQ